MIPPEEKELYRFGVQQGLSIALNVVTTFVIGLVFQMVLESFLFLAAYIPLRSLQVEFMQKQQIDVTYIRLS